VKRLLGMTLALGLLAPLSACGWYTNVPAQIHARPVNSLIVTYEEPGAGAKATYKATVSESVLTLAGQPGSIGASFRNVTIRYYTPGGKDPVFERSFPIDLRVEPSVYREDPRKDELGDKNWEDNKLIIGTGQLSLTMLVDRAVMDYGFSKTGGQLYALLDFTGEDDAKFSQRLEVSVPIVFTGYSQ
jgi:hypothetical protein